MFNQQQDGPIRRNPVNQVVIIIVLLAGLLAWLFWHRQVAGQRRVAGDSMSVLALKVSRFAQLATAGNEKAFENLGTATQVFATALQDVNVHGDPQGDESLLAVNKAWVQVSEDSQTVLASQDALVSLHDVQPRLLEELGDFSAADDALVASLLTAGASSAQIVQAAQIAVITQRLRYAAVAAMAVNSGAVPAATGFGDDLQRLGHLIDGQVNGSEELHIARLPESRARELLLDLSNNYQQHVLPDGTSFHGHLLALYKAADASNHINHECDDLLVALEKLGNAS